jgi:F-type H+-transporting ATPase subunit delta
MAQEKATLARPYAQAIFRRAEETNTLDLWSEVLALLTAVVETPEIAALIGSPKLSRQDLQRLLLEVCDDQLTNDAKNLVRLLTQNNRLALVSEIAAYYARLKGELQGRLQVHVLCAFPPTPDQEAALAAALERRLRCRIELTSDTDSSLIGGVLVHAGDLVIDASVRGQLQRLANELRI